MIRIESHRRVYKIPWELYLLEQKISGVDYIRVPRDHPHGVLTATPGTMLTSPES